MTYYYLTADGTTAGPEPLETLATLIENGAVSLATLVVPAGGEDWTPLARVLRFFYADETSATSGPVAFSEIHRLNQTAVLTAESWVLHEGGTQWQALSAVLAAGGVELAAPPAPAVPVAAPVMARTATGAYRPQAGHTQAVSAAAHHAPTKATAAHKVVVRRRHTGGMDRLQYFLYSFGINLLFVLLLLAIGAGVLMHGGSAPMDRINIFLKQSLVVILVVGIVASVASIIFAVQRLKNIGWPWFFLFLSLVPIVNLWISLALLGYPPGYAHHRRFDTAAKVIFGIAGLLIAGGITAAIIAFNRKA